MPLPPRRTTTATATVVAALVAVVGCGSGERSASACSPIRREALDSSYLVHVIGDTDVVYTSDPPTSGPHQAGPRVAGVVDEPIERPIQVGILEQGDILIQHDPDLPAAARAELAALGGPSVVVAPNPDLPTAVVATGWTYKRTCDAVDAAALQEFIDARAGKGPDS